MHYFIEKCSIRHKCFCTTYKSIWIFFSVFFITEDTIVITSDIHVSECPSSVFINNMKSGPSFHKART